MKRARRQISVSLAAVLAVLGFMVLTSVTATQRARRSAEPRRSQLVGLIRARQRDVDTLDRKLTSLRSALTRAQRGSSRRSDLDASRSLRAQRDAGLTSLAGPGLEVVLSDSARQARDATERAALRIRDSDLQLVVNALWAAGAEAVAVNGQRLVSTTAIRLAGQTVTVNFRPLAPPYRVSAIGAVRARFDRSDVARRFREWVDAFGLGYSVHRRDHIAVPAYAGRVALAVAQVLGPGPPDAGSGEP